LQLKSNNNLNFNAMNKQTQNPGKNDTTGKSGSQSGKSGKGNSTMGNSQSGKDSRKSQQMEKSKESGNKSATRVNDGE
jgi:hypothetical protein